MSTRGFCANEEGMDMAQDAASSGNETWRGDVDRRFAARGWTLGRRMAFNERRQCAYFDAVDAAGHHHWLYVGPWREWERVQQLWAHLMLIDEALSQLGSIFRAWGSLLPRMQWGGGEGGYWLVAEDRLDAPYVAPNRGRRRVSFPNMVQLTVFLRLLELGAPEWATERAAATSGDSLMAAARSLVDCVEDRVPDAARSTRWAAFYLSHARSLAHARSLRYTLSLGADVTRCFALDLTGALRIVRPFFVYETLQGNDLSHCLYEFSTYDRQDRNYLINLYFNFDVPSYFFTRLAYHHMTCVLQALLRSRPGSDAEAHALDRWAQLRDEYEQFRAPVPKWFDA
jgi:hypothetical protein